ncbi:magnesium/cobalt transporter CorA [Ferviditalea candida]|uniref:magnesium/cobalt transporter CorA n=1 Tax=Ferviditalea candida TaxID=3108399 RepID=UPI00352DE77A
MQRILAITRAFELLTDIPLNALANENIKWYWVDFNEPTEEEAKLLADYFHFHPLAIEDCLHLLQRPKLDHYGDTHFLVMHAIDPDTLSVEEVDLFLGSSFLVTFHAHPSKEIDEIWDRINTQPSFRGKGPLYAAYKVMDKLVDQYFPAVLQLEEQLSEIENNVRNASIQKLMDDIFNIRAKLVKLRKTILPARDLFYRIVNSERIDGIRDQSVYFMDVYNHLLKLSELIDSIREMTSDLRDSYISVNANRMNTIMKTLTVITTIFMPLTFIVGIYGMNFECMPELKWKWGYFTVLGVMLGIGFGMFWFFRRKGWFR